MLFAIGQQVTEFQLKINNVQTKKYIAFTNCTFSVHEYYLFIILYFYGNFVHFRFSLSC